MTVGVIIAIVMVVFLVMLAIETPVAMVLAASGLLGLLLLRSFDIGMATLGNEPFVVTANYNLAIIPMYILLGMFALNGHLARRLFIIAARVFRRLPGGLGVATVGACAGFAAMTGSSIATAASIGRMSVGEMMKLGYSGHLATGIVATAGTLGILIPPSVILALYGVQSGESIASLLIAGIVPGVLFAVLIAATVIVLFRREVVATPESQSQNLERELILAGGGRASTESTNKNNEYDASQVIGTSHGQNLALGSFTGEKVKETPSSEQPTRFQKVRALIWVAAIFVAVLLGIFTGLFTVSESAAIGSFLALVMLIFENIRSGLRTLIYKFANALKETAAVTSMALGLVVGAGIFTVFLVSAKVPVSLTNWVTSLDVPPILVVILILALLIPLGMFLEGLSILIIVVPLIHPIIVELGFDGIWFAILFVVMLELGMITPPVGINSFVVSTATGVPLTTVFRGILPFVGTGIILIIILMLFPSLVTALPDAIVK